MRSGAHPDERRDATVTTADDGVEELDDGAEPVVDDDGAALDGRRRPRYPRRVRWLSLVLAAVAIGLAVLTVLWGNGLRDRQATDQERTRLLAAARQEAVNFTTIDYQALDESIANVLSLATGSFREQFVENEEQLRMLVTANEAVSTGEVREAGVVVADDTSARVLAFVDSTVRNTATPEGQPRFYRLLMDLTKTDDRWLVTDLQFVGG